MKTGGSVKKNTPATVTTTPTGGNSKKNVSVVVTTSPKGNLGPKNTGAAVNPTKPTKLKNGGSIPKHETGGWKTYSGYGKYPVTKSKK